MTAEKLSIPNIPRFETVNVAPDSSAGVIEPSRARAAKVRAARAISATGLASASKIVGTSSVSSAATATPTFTRSNVSTAPSR